MIAFSLTNRPRLGQAKGGLALRGKARTQVNKETGTQGYDPVCTCLRFYVSTCFPVSVFT